MVSRSRLMGIATLACFLAAARSAPPPRSVLRIDEVRAAPGATVLARVWLEDRSGTPLGIEQPAGRRIQGLAFRVLCHPTGAVESIVARRAGATAGREPLFSASPVALGAASFLASFAEAAEPLPLRPEGRRGQVVAVLEIRLSSRVRTGTGVELRLDPAVSVLSNQAGTIVESSGNGWLALRDGRVTVGR